MALNEKQIYTETFIAGEDLSDYQYYGVTMSDDREVDLTDADTDVCAGILLNAPESGGEALVGVVGRFPVVAGETITAGQLVRIGSSGTAMIWAPGTDTTAYVIGQALSGGDAGEKIEVMVNACNPARGDC